MCHHYPSADKRAAQGLFDFCDLTISSEMDHLFGGTAEFYPLYEVPVALMNGAEWVVESRTWGFLPPRWKPSERFKTEKAFRRQMVNARSEGITTKWPWKLSAGRCVLIASGFFEPHQPKVEALFEVKGKPAIGIAGLLGDNGSCTMLTCDANELVAANRTGRKRQPVLLTNADELTAYCSGKDLFDPFPAEHMKMSTRSK